MIPAIPFPFSRQLPIGLHVDGDSVALAQIALHGGRPIVHATAAGELPIDPSDSNGAGAALRRLIADHHFAGRAVISSLPPRDLTIQNVRLPQVPEEELPPLLRWEAQERLPYPVEEAELRHLNGGIVRDEGVVKQEVILLAVRREAIDRHLALLHAARLVPIAIDLAGSGIVRCVGAGSDRELSHGDSSRRAYVSLGMAAATVVVADAAGIMFLKHLSCGGRHLDQMLARAVGIPESEAAAMRRTVIRSPALDASDDLHRTVIEALRIPLEGLATDLELCLRHVKVAFRGSPPESLLVTGPDAAPWLAEFFADRLHLPAKVFDPFAAFGRQTSVPDLPGRFTAAVGLSLRGASTRNIELAASA